MPKMDGMESIKQVMAKTPLPILVISDAVQKQDIENVFQVLKAGAVDVMPKPAAVSSGNQEELKRSLITKIRVLASKQVSAKPLP